MVHRGEGGAMGATSTENPRGFARPLKIGAHFLREGIEGGGLFGGIGGA